MKRIKEYMIDGIEPTEEEFMQCINIANAEHCRVRLVFGYIKKTGAPKSITIPPGATYEDLMRVYEQNKYGLFRDVEEKDINETRI